MGKNIPTYDDVQKIREALMESAFSHWYHDELFSPHWWFLLLSTLLPYYLWWKVVDKARF